MQAQGGSVESLVDAIQIELGYQSHLEAGQIEIDSKAGRIMTDKEQIPESMENQAFVIEMKVIKGTMVNPEHPISQQYILMTS